MKPPPPRLHVVPAIGCDRALVLRRGPAGAVASLIWDRGRDTLDVGQWLRGRIYEHRCDLSPDGRHMVYFAGTGQRWWTAVSRAPWLRAVAFWPQGGTWHGGGAFDAEGRLWMNGAEPGTDLPDGLRAAPVDAFPHATDGFHMGGMYAAMMALRGWRHVSGTRYDTVLAKPAATGWWVELRIALNARNRGLVSNAYALVHAPSGARSERPDWEWAEPCAAGLQVAAGGALREIALSPLGQARETRIIRDLSDMRFEAVEAPYAGVSAP